MIYEQHIDIITDTVVAIKATDEEGREYYIPIDPNNKDYKRYLESLES